MDADAPLYFETAKAMRSWLRKNHAKATELFVGYRKKHAVDAGARSITWPESVAEALCFGWIDGVRKSVDAERYRIRFTPRRPGGKWSAVNIRLVGELKAAGRMTAAGRAVFQARKDAESKGYKAQKKVGTLDNVCLKVFKRNKSAWAFFQAQPPGYQSMMAWWVMQAKQEETRSRRLQKLVEGSANQERLA